MKNEDDWHASHTFPIKFKFFNEHYSHFFISINGILQLTRNAQESFGVYPYPKRFPFANLTIVAPFWSDINTLKSGEVYYREIGDFYMLSRLACDIGKIWPTFAFFKPSWAFLATWYEVNAHGYANAVEYHNTFQV